MNQINIKISTNKQNDESHDWVSSLQETYKKFAVRKGFTCSVMDEKPGPRIGLESCCLQIIGQNVWSMLQGESGVHSRTRISPYDSNGRRWTVYAEIAVAEFSDPVAVGTDYVRRYIAHPYTRVYDGYAETDDIEAVLDGGLDLFLVGP